MTRMGSLHAMGTIVALPTGALGDLHDLTGPSPFIDPVCSWAVTQFAIPSRLKIWLQDGEAQMSADTPVRAVVDPYGEPVTADTLPATETVRWIARRKAQVVCAIRGGLISREEACDRYGISNAELFSWEHLLDEHGLRALRVTRIQQYRQPVTLIEEEAEGS